MTIPDEILDELEELERAATKGNTKRVSRELFVGEVSIIRCAFIEDARFISALRNESPALIAAVRASRMPVEVRETIRSALSVDTSAWADEDQAAFAAAIAWLDAQGAK